MLEARLDPATVSKTFRVLRELDPNLVKELRTELRTELTSTAKDIANEYPKSPILSGFRMSYGKWGWDTVIGKVKITPGRSRKGAGAKNLVSISMEHKVATPYALDMIGWQSYGRDARGRALWSAMQRFPRFSGWPRGGRIFYRPFKAKRGEVVDKTEGIINRWTKKVNRELN